MDKLRKHFIFSTEPPNLELATDAGPRFRPHNNKLGISALQKLECPRCRPNIFILNFQKINRKALTRNLNAKPLSPISGEAALPKLGCGLVFIACRFLRRFSLITFEIKCTEKLPAQKSAGRDERDGETVS